MKKKLCFLGVLLCAMMAALPVRADVIWTPEDSFYERNEAECEYVNRQYTANGPDGKVTIYESPESPKAVSVLENGTVTNISFTYTDKDGILWGVYGDGGWVPMDYMEVVYDSISFSEEHSKEIKQQPGSLDEKYMGEKLYVWKYPGSEECYALEGEMYEFMPEYDVVYVDEEGKSWGNISYFYGYKDVWVCIDQPTADAEQLYPEGVPKRETKETAQNQKEHRQEANIVPKASHGTVLLAIVIVAAVVLVTAGLLVFLRFRRFH